MVIEIKEGNKFVKSYLFFWGGEISEWIKHLYGFCCLLNSITVSLKMIKTVVKEKSYLALERHRYFPHLEWWLRKNPCTA